MPCPLIFVFGEYRNISGRDYNVLVILFLI